MTDNVLAQPASDKPLSSEHAYPVSTAEVVAAKRTTRVQKPEVHYQLGPTQRPSLRSASTESPTPSASAQPQVVIQQPPVPTGQDQVLQAVPANLNNPDNVHNPEDHVSDDDDDEVFVLDPTDMAEDKTVMPPVFSGKATDDADAWIRHFNNYCIYKEYSPAKSLALFRVLLSGNAALWLDALPAAMVDDLDRLRTAFSERYQTPEILKFKNAKEMFSKKQGEFQSVDDYIAEMRKLAQKINADEKLICYAVLNGLKNCLVPYITQQNPQTVDNLLVAARMAEVTAPAVPAADSHLSDQLADVQTEVKRLAQRWDKLVSAPVFEPRNTNEAQRRSPSPRRVTFAETNPQRPWSQPANRGRGNNFAPNRGMRGAFQRGSFQRPANPQGWAPPQRCQKCGRQAHANLNQCPAINKACAYCGRIGHFAATCRAAGRRAQLYTRRNE